MEQIKKKNIGYFIFIICYIAYTSIYISRLNLSVATPSLTGENIISTEQIGLLNGIFFCVYAIGRFFFGRLSDRIAPFAMISFGLFFSGISNILFGFMPPFFALTLLWSVNAISQSMLWSSVLVAISVRYGTETARKLNPYMVTSVAFGNIVAIIFNTFLINSYGTAYAFIIPGGITLLLSFICFFSLKNLNFSSDKTEKQHLSVASLLSLKSVRYAAYAALAHGVIKDNVTAWMNVYLADTYSLDLTGISSFVLFIPLVGFAGRMIYPAIYKACKYKEHNVSLIGFAICLIFSVPLIIVNIGPVASVICMSLIYMAISLINSTLLSVFPLNYAESGNLASVSGFMDFCTYLGAGIGSVVFGVTISRMGYSSMFISWAVISLLAFLPIKALIKQERK